MGKGDYSNAKSCVAHGVPKPKIGGSESDIYVEFKNHEADMAKKIAKMEETREKMTGKIPKPAILKETEAQMTVQVNLKMPLKILELLLFNPSMTISELAEKINKSRSTTKRAVHRLP